MLLKIRPRTKQRPRLGKRRKAYTPAPTIEFEKAVRKGWVKEHGAKPLEGPVEMVVVIGTDYIDVQVEPLDEPLRPKYVTGDVDNYHKSIQDALNRVAYLDDKQVHRIRVEFTKEER